MKLMLKGVGYKSNDRNMFLGSNDLKDLHQLLDQVRSSQALVIIFTENYFTRPWCVAELVAAHQAKIPLVSCILVNVSVEFEPENHSTLVENYENMLDASG